MASSSSSATVVLVLGARRRSASARFSALSPALRMSSASEKAASAIARSTVAPGTWVVKRSGIGDFRGGQLVVPRCGAANIQRLHLVQPRPQLVEWRPGDGHGGAPPPALRRCAVVRCVRRAPALAARPEGGHVSCVCLGAARYMFHKASSCSTSVRRWCTSVRDLAPPGQREPQWAECPSGDGSRATRGPQLGRCRGGTLSMLRGVITR